MDVRGLVDVAALRSGDLMLQPLEPFPPFEEFPALGEALNVMIDRLNALIPRGGVGVKVKDTGAGLTIETQLIEESTNQRVQFRGEFAKGFAYSNGDLVRVSAGPEAGTYIAIKDVPANPNNDPQYLPWTGTGYWVLLARLTDQSQWV